MDGGEGVALAWRRVRVIDWVWVFVGEFCEGGGMGWSCS